MPHISDFFIGVESLAIFLKKFCKKSKLLGVDISIPRKSGVCNNLTNIVVDRKESEKTPLVNIDEKETK